MVKAVMEAFPLIPDVKFGISKKEMKKERRDLGLPIRKASGSLHVNHADNTPTIYINTYIKYCSCFVRVIDEHNSCAMYVALRSPGPGCPITDWVSCCEAAITM